MAQTSATTSGPGALLWAGRAPVSELERMLAARRISEACAAGRISDAQARMRLARVPAASTRTDLAAALAGVPGAALPPALLALSRIATVAWVILGILQFLVWLIIESTSGGSGEVWWIWWPIGGVPVVAAMWWIVEHDHRPRGGRAR